METVSGFVLKPDFLTRDEERDLLSKIDQAEWNTTLSRRTQHYGYIYDYQNKAATQVTTPIPRWAEFIIERLLDEKLLKQRPDQMIVNEYVPGQGIFPHVDDATSFGDGIVSVSMGSDIVMDFVKQNEKRQVILKTRSVLVLHDEARYKWRHGITARKKDNGVTRMRRVSLTFRKMNRKRLLT